MYLHAKTFRVHRRELDNVAAKLGIKKQEDWYSITADDAKKHTNILFHYNNSLIRSLQKNYPEYSWKPWLFGTCMKGYMNHPMNKKKYFDWLGEQLGIQTQEQWYKLKVNDLHRFGGFSVMQYSNSIYDALKEVYPEKEWVPWKFEIQPRLLWNNPRNCRMYFEWLADNLQIFSQNQWYQLKNDDVYKHSGDSIMAYYEDNLCNALRNTFPEYEWYPWLFSAVPHGYWQEDQNLRKYCDWVATKLNITCQEEWYSVLPADITVFTNKNVATELALHRILPSVYPEFIWYPWKFHKVPEQFWFNHNNRRAYFDWLFEKLQLRTQHDWYGVTTEDVAENSGSGLMVTVFSSSILEALKSVYPEFKWYPWIFGKNRLWANMRNQREYVDWLADELNIEKTSDWYRVNESHFVESGGQQLLGIYTNSVYSLLSSVYPECKWEPHLFDTMEQWSTLYHQRKTFDAVADEHHMEKLEQWYTFKANQLKRGQLKLITSYYDGSLATALENIYPEFNWLPWLYQRAPDGFWNSAENVQKFLTWFERQLGITRKEDWYLISTQQFKVHGGNSLLATCGGLYNVLQKYIPDIQWNKKLFSSVTQLKTQKALFKAVQGIVGKNVAMKLNHKAADMYYEKTQEQIELDIFIPQLSLAFEYQGEHHFHSTRQFGQQEEYQERDKEKQELCAKNGITLIQVPFWWDLSTASLMATIHRVRPDIVSSPGEGKPIPNRMPQHSVNTRKRSALSFARI